MSLKNYSGWIILTLLSFSPLILWFFAIQPIALRFTNPGATLTSLGQTTALVGTAMYALSFVLSTRLEFLEEYFGGMNKVYVAHHAFGGIAFVFLLFHPLFLAASYIPVSINSAALYILPGNDWAINLGISGLFFTMALLIFTFYANIPYNVWKLTHKFLGAAFFVSALHGFFASSDISRVPFLKIYMLMFFVIALISFTYRTILGSVLVRKLSYTVTEINKKNKSVLEIGMTPDKKAVSYVPGQFLFVSFRRKGFSPEWHPFSISTVSTNQTLVLTVKAEGDWTKKLLNLTVGTKALVEGSYGEFSYQREAHHKNQIWIAGGIGIVPFYSMARDLSPDYTVDLFYTVRDEDEAVYLKELMGFALKRNNFRIFPFYTKAQGRLTAEIIDKITGSVKGKSIFICGPPPMMTSLRRQFIKIGVKKDYIHSEEFQIQ